MVDCMLISMPVDLLVMLLSITTSSLGIAVLICQRMAIALLLFIIGGFVSGGLILIQMLFRLNLTPIFFTLQLLAYIFQITSGIIFCINIIHHHLDFSKGFKGWEVTIPILFIIDVFFMAISITLLFVAFIQSSPTEIEDIDFEKNNVSLSDSFSDSPTNGTYPFQSDVPSQHLAVKQDQQVSKKISEQTLVEGPIYDTVVKNRYNNTNDDNDLAYIMNYSPNDETSDYLYYNNKNWMDSNANLHSIKLSADLTNTPVSETSTKPYSKKSNFGLLKINMRGMDSTNKLASDNPKVISNLKQSRSVPNFLKTTNLDLKIDTNNKKPKFEPIPGLDLKDILKLNQNCSHSKSSSKCTYDQHADIKLDEPNFNKFRRGSLIQSSLNENPTEEHITRVNENKNFVKRSKSTSFISGGKSRKLNIDQRRMSIHDEKNFLRNINECLLPAVLRSGESPIMELKRQQEIMGKQNEEKAKSPLNQKYIKHSSGLQRDLGSDLSPVGEADLSEAEKSNIAETADSHNSPDYLNLPFISEFDEPLDQGKFKGFDQDTAVVEEQPYENYKKTPKKKGTYQFNDTNYEKQTLAQSGQQEVEEWLPNDYYKSLNGLEKIPKSSSTPNIMWKQEEKASGTLGSMNHISLKDWDTNSTKWNEHRTRSGANLNIAGITRLVSDHNLKSMSIDSNSIIPADMDLLPPLEYRLDDIDNLSDLHSATGSAKGMENCRSTISLNRSSSAPSLHTYRESYPVLDEAYDDPQESKSISLKSLDNTLHHVSTPPERQAISTTSSSPIKKFFHESPKRLNVIFKRKPMNSRYSLDLSSLKDPNINVHHKHTSSVVSNQFSLHSGKSSKSGSPRKSFRALLRSPSKFQAPSPMEPSLEYSSKTSSQNNLFNTNDDNCLVYFTENALSFWDLDTAHSSDRSRVSSVPSAVIGEYDKEKWRTLKALQNQEKVSLERVEA